MADKCVASLHDHRFHGTHPNLCTQQWLTPKEMVKKHTHVAPTQTYPTHIHKQCLGRFEAKQADRQAGGQADRLPSISHVSVVEDTGDACAVVAASISVIIRNTRALHPGLPRRPKLSPLLRSKKTFYLSILPRLWHRILIIFAGSQHKVSPPSKGGS